MTIGIDALALLIETADQINARLIKRINATEASFEITLELSDGSSRIYLLSLVDKKNKIYAKETTANQLPSSCPERHINDDGTFCINWQGFQDLTVLDQKSAIEWWSHLLRYLSLQVRAAKNRKWPGKEWAHGNAAKFQNSAENAARALGAEYYDLLIQKQLTVKHVKLNDSRGPLLRLYLGSKHLCSVWKTLDIVANKRQTCLCIKNSKVKRKPIRSCSDHAIQIKELITSIFLQDLEIELFWKYRKGQSCCMTMDNCPLNVAS